VNKEVSLESLFGQWEIVMQWVISHFLSRESSDKVELAFIMARMTCLMLANALKSILAFGVFENKILIGVSNSCFA